MLPLVELPDIVRHDAPWLASVFSPAAFAQFQRYISGVIVSENQTVAGINRIFVIDVRKQSRLHRWLTGSPLAVEALNQARLELLSSLSGTQMKLKGVLSLDDTLWTHDGKHVDTIASLDDPTKLTLAFKSFFADQAERSPNLVKSGGEYPILASPFSPPAPFLLLSRMLCVGTPSGQAP